MFVSHVPDLLVIWMMLLVTSEAKYMYYREDTRILIFSFFSFITQILYLLSVMWIYQSCQPV